MADLDKAYEEMAKGVNTTLGRKAISVADIKKEIKKAREVRQQYGLMGLVSYAQETPYRFFSQKELDKLKESPEFYKFSHRFIDLMVVEGVITNFEAAMARRRIR